MIRRTLSCLTDLTLAAAASTLCWLRRDAYFAGAQAALDAPPFNLVDLRTVLAESGCAVEPMTPEEQVDQARAAFEAFDHDVAAETVTYYIDARPRSEIAAALLHLEEVMCDWRREVYLCADSELEELVKGDQ